MFCTHCGASNRDDASLCINCNESLRDNPIEEKLSRLRGPTDPSPFHQAGFLRPLFDFSFRHFVTMKLIKFLYLLSVLSAGLAALSIIFMGFNISLAFGVFALLIGAPLVFLLTVTSSRVFLEMNLRIFRMADLTARAGKVEIKEKPDSKDGIQWNV